jgi:predicted helicase
LVGVNSDGNGYTAIQCKFYDKEATVPKAGVDSFIASSNKPFFTRRFLVATNEHWTDPVKEEFQQQTPPVTLITRETLASSIVDWAAYQRGELKEVAKRTPRDYQKEAIKKVISGFKSAARGKLIMACGTGKTYTSLKIAEEQAGAGKLVLFLVPSLSLLSQTLTDWKQQCIYPINAFAVCSDSSTGKADLEDLESLTVGSELAYPATTDARSLCKQIRVARERKDAMTVVFSTYQSIDVIHQAQTLETDPIGEFDLVICDEAHRTAGGHFTDEKEAVFTRIHNNDYVAAKKRLYMTATPKIYGSDAKKQNEDGDIVLYSMDDEEVYGKTFHSINFTEAVRLGSLVDYKVIVLTVSESLIGDKNNPEELILGAEGGLSVSNAAKVIGCWRALSKRDLQGEVSLGDDLQPMRRAVGFAQVINPSDKYDKVSSKQFTAEFQNTIERFKDKLRKETKYLNQEFFNEQNSLVCDTRHIDGSMDATEKANRLEWLRAETEEGHCKILFNVRCLSEGVDVPALDAVIFLSPRKSMVDVVQTVGRVMRTSKDTKKERGYVIIPIVTPAGIPADYVLDNNKDFQTVWQVLRALKSIDEDFGSMVDGQLKSINSEKLEVICLTDKKFTRKAATGGNVGGIKRRHLKKRKGDAPKQMELPLGRDMILEEDIRARIVKKVGNRKEWSDWAADVARICEEQVKHIKAVLDRSENESSRKKFESFSVELKNTLNGELSREEILDMLGQHIVTKPVMDALFSEFPFTEKNPISRAMTQMLDALDKEGLKSATKLLEGFYNSVRVRAKNIKTAEDRQTVIIELFDKFFKHAFPKMRDKLGIVYTPVPVVDFINYSVADVLKKEFGTTIDAPNVHILDPFTGTGTFLTRLMQSGLISKENLPQKFNNDMHAQEIVPLAYYVASMNLEATYHELVPGLEYEPNPVMIWTDTFADHDAKTLFSTSLAENNARLAKTEELDIRVIIGNPPYSVGQDDANDNNQNEHYLKLDMRISETYMKRGSKERMKGSLYDSYIRAYRWASDRIKEKGVIGFVTNAGWIESNSADGMRKCMADEFNSIYIYHLKGNQRTSGERSRQEGGKVFGEGSRAPVAIVLLVKNPDDTEKGKIYFHAVDDYLTREEKLAQLTKAESVLNVEWQRIYPDKHGDWLNLRDESFRLFIPIGAKKSKEETIFSDYSRGLGTSRDPWGYNSDKNDLKGNVKKSIDFYNRQQALFATLKLNKVEGITKAANFVTYDPTQISWAGGLLKLIERGKKISFEDSEVRRSAYRPFFPQYLYCEKSLINEGGALSTKFFPIVASENLAICVNQGAKATDGFIALMVNQIADLHFNGDSQCFPRYIYKSKADSRQNSENDLFAEESEVVTTDGFVKEDAINDEALKHFQEVYQGNSISKDDLFYYIYGILHSPDYRTKYANNLSKELPRIPRVATFDQFKAFAAAGRKLADLHVNFEKQPRYKGVTVQKREGCSFRVTQMRWDKIAGKTGNAAKDKTRLIYNEDITIENIPLEAQEYVVNKKSALDWIVERCRVSIDKDSGIVNDFNKYGEEMGDPTYPYDLFLKVITVSLETMKIVKALPALEIHPLDKKE